MRIRETVGTTLVLFLAFLTRTNAQLGMPCEFSIDCANPFEQTCNNNFVCACRSGFTEASGTCVDVNECILPTSPCSPQAECTNSEGSFSCACASGFVGDGVTCTPSSTLDVVRITGVRNTSFQVNYTDVPSAVYMIRVYQGSGLSIETTTNLTNVTFELADPTRNVYMVEVAYTLNGVQNSFSPRISTKIWNITSVTSNNISIEWELFSPVSLYEYDVCNAQGVNVDNGNAPNNTHTFQNLQPSTLYTIKVLASRLLPPLRNVTHNIAMVPLFIIDQYTVTIPPNPRVTSQTKTDLNIVWSRVPDAQSYITRLFLNNVPVSGILGLGPTNTLRTTLITLSPGLNYTFQLCAINKGGESCTDLPVFGYLLPPDPPQPIQIMQTSITLSIPVIPTVTNYTFTASLNTGERVLIESPTSMATISRLQPSTNYSVRTTVTYPAGSVEGEATFVETAHAVTNLTAAVSGTAAFISFDSVSRLEQFSITTTILSSQNQIATTTITASEAKDDGVRTSGVVNNLTPNTMYRFFVIVDAQDQIGVSQSATGSVDATTLNFTRVQFARVIGVTSSGFNVSIEEVQQATSYTVQVYLRDVLISETEFLQANVPITGVDPVANEYFVSAAFNTPAPSEFSPRITTRIWNFTDVGITTLNATWTAYSTTAFYEYDVADTSGNNLANGNTRDTTFIFNELKPGSINIIQVAAAEFSSSSNAITVVPLFAIPQLTRPAAPTPTIESQDFVTLFIIWNDVAGADRYEPLFTFPDGSSVPGANLRRGIGNRVSINNLNVGVNYRFMVCSVNAVGRSCGELNVSGLTRPPQVPTVISVTQTTIEVRIDGVITAVSYSFSSELENGQLVSVTPSSMPSAVILNLTPGTTYRLSATIIYQSEPVTGGSVLQTTAPADPINVRLEAATSSSVVAAWNNDNSVTESLLTMERVDGETTVFQDRRVIGTSHQIENLQSGTNYTLCVRNRNSAGSSGPSCISFQTGPATPTGLNYGAVTQTTIEVVFNKVVGAERYTLTINPPLQDVTIFTTSYRFTGLSPGTIYSITVQAFSAASVNPLGSLSSSVSASLEVTTAPYDVSGLSVTSRSSTTLTISYSTSIGATSYRVSWTLSAVDSPSSRTVTTSTATISGLEPGTSYDITVVAVNLFGVSMNTGMLANECTRSVSPLMPVLSTFTTTSFIASWSTQTGAVSYIPLVVLASNGSRPSGIIYPSNTSMLQIAVTGLMPGTEYTVSITTNDRFGLVEEGGGASDVTVPGRTTRLEITRQDTESLGFEWSSVQGATFYQVVVRDIRTNTIRREQNVIGLTFIADGLSNGEEYMISISAANKNGVGMPVSATAFTVINPFEAVVTFVNNTESTITVNHTAGVPGVISYRIIAKIKIIVITTCESNGFICTLTGLDSGTDYNISVIGIYSSIAQSQPSSPLLLTTIPARPDNPVVIRQDFNLFVTVRRVFGATTYTAALGAVYIVSTPPGFLFADLFSGQNYSISVFATKVTTYGDFISQPLIIDTSTTRAIPFGVTVANVRQSQFDVLWNSVVGATSYTVTVTLVRPPQTVRMDTETRNALTVNNLEAGELYNVTVRGNYRNGPGEDSQVIQQITAPDIPFNLRIVSVGATFVQLTWNVVRTASMYRMTYSALTETTFRSTELSTNLITASGLTPATVYRFEVVAFEGVLESSAAQLHQITAPRSPRFVTTGATQTTIMAAWTTESGTASFVVQILLEGVEITQISTPESSESFSFMDGIRPGQNYSFCVRGRTANTTTVGIPQLSEINCTIVTTDPGNATSLVEISTTSTSLTVGWSPAEGASYYVINAVFLRVTQRLLSIPLRATVFGRENGTVIGLTSNSDYDVFVTPFNFLNQASFRLGGLTVTTNPDTPLVFIIDVTDTTMTVRWETDPMFIFLSMVRVRQIDACDRSPAVEESGEFFTRMGYIAQVSNLCPAVRYNVTVTVFTTLKKSKPGFQIQVTAPVSPQNVRIIRATQELIVCVWDPSVGADFYFVIVRRIGTVIFETITTTPNVTITNLKTAEVYSFELIAGNSALNSSATIINTTTVTIPLQPIVQRINATSKGFSIHFVQPLPGTTISVEGVSTTGHTVNAFNLTGKMVTFTNIILGVRYDFTFVAINFYGDRSPVTRKNATAPLNGIPSRVKLLPSIQYQEAYDNLTSPDFISLRNQIGNELISALTPGTGLMSVKVEEIYLSGNCIYTEFTSNTNTPNTTFNFLNQTFQLNKNINFFTPLFTTSAIPLPPVILNGTLSDGVARFTIARLPSTTSVTLIANNSLGNTFVVENVVTTSVVLANITLGATYTFTFFAVNSTGAMSQSIVLSNITAPPLTFSVQVGLVASLASDPALSDPTSPQYTLLVQQLTSEIQNALVGIPGFSDVRVTNIDQGSVTAEFTITVTRQDISTNMLTETFENNIQSADSIVTSLVRIYDNSETLETVDTSLSLSIDTETENLFVSPTTSTTATTTTTTSQNNVGDESGLNAESINNNEHDDADAGLILGSVFGVIVGIVIIAVLLNIFFCRQRREYKKFLC